MNLEKIAEEVRALCDSTGRFLNQEFVGFDRSKASTKANFKDLVSFVDREAEDRLITGLRHILPEAKVLGEETSENAQRLESDLYWIVDPLDGTTNFIHGIPLFSISIALLIEQEASLGIVYEVGRKECFHAIKGQGAFMDQKRISVSSVTDPRETLTVTGFPYDSFDKFENYMNAIKAFLRDTHGVRRFGSAAIDLSYVACGRFEAFFEVGLHPWDVAAGSLIVQEAGGIVTDFSGKTDYLFGGEIFAANKAHPDLLEIFNQEWSPK